MPSNMIESNYRTAVELYSDIGVDVDEALQSLGTLRISLPCWQGDDVCGFEPAGGELSGGGIMATGGYPGKARNIEELQQDLSIAFSLIPGNHRLNLHAIYGDFKGKPIERSRIEPRHFSCWIDWVKEKKLGLDFNATLFSHPMAESNYTLSSRDKAVRSFWIDHVNCCREISAWIGRQLGIPCLHNLWIPDGSKDIPVARLDHRELLKGSLETIYAVKYPSDILIDSVEGKLFGIGSESYVVGSYDFYLAAALTNEILLCLDMGHFHPTESVADKVSSLLLFFNELVLHLSRGIRWDSDHVVIQNDDLSSLAQEIVRAGALNRVHLGLDFFDASINRIGAWVIGARATLKAFLFALLEPVDTLREMEEEGKHFQRLALLEEMKSLPWGSVWEYFCVQNNVPGDRQWQGIVEDYEVRELSKR